MSNENKKIFVNDLNDFEIYKYNLKNFYSDFQQKYTINFITENLINSLENENEKENLKEIIENNLKKKGLSNIIKKIINNDSEIVKNINENIIKNSEENKFIFLKEEKKEESKKKIEFKIETLKNKIPEIKENFFIEKFISNEIDNLFKNNYDLNNILLNKENDKINSQNLIENCVKTNENEGKKILEKKFNNLNNLKTLINQLNFDYNNLENNYNNLNNEINIIKKGNQNNKYNFLYEKNII
jgi:hypothetical protein